jgi:hypothetical protein
VRLRQRVFDDVDWQVQVVTDPIALDQNGSIPMVDLARQYRSENDWHIVVLITHLPLRLGTVPLVADYNPEHCVALVSLPAMGHHLAMDGLAGRLRVWSESSGPIGRGAWFHRWKVRPPPPRQRQPLLSSTSVSGRWLSWSTRRGWC